MSDMRSCDNCDVVDDHPRVQFQDGPNLRLFHYDCTPKFIREVHPSPGYKAADSGKRGADVAEVVINAAEKEDK